MALPRGVIRQNEILIHALLLKTTLTVLLTYSDNISTLYVNANFYFLLELHQAYKLIW